jgi:hypothetical protein
MRGHADVLFFAARVAKAEVDELHALFLDGFQNVFTRHG